jgi:hypothetical protein
VKRSCVHPSYTGTTCTDCLLSCGIHRGRVSGVQLADFKQGKRYKKITKLLLSKGCQKAVIMLRTHIYYVLFAILAIHVAAFWAFTHSISNLTEYAFSLDVVAAAKSMQQIKRAAAVVASASVPRKVGAHRSPPVLPCWLCACSSRSVAVY